MSRHAPGVELWGALRGLGKRGLVALVERTCSHAQRLAEVLRAEGFEVLNEVAINQVLVSFGDAETTRRVVAHIQQEGTCWCGITEWHGQTAVRISVSSGATTDEDRERSWAAMCRPGASGTASFS